MNGRQTLISVAALLIGLAMEPMETSAQSITTSEARAIAKEAYIYGFPPVDSYRILYSYFVDRDSSEYKGGWNQIYNTARVFTPEDVAMQTPNSDTPYSHLGLDLRTEPMVLSVPAVVAGRYYSVEFNDLYTFIFSYVGSRATGNDAGNFLVVGPSWNGQTPAGIKRVIRSETELAFLFFRTQLLNPSDIDNVKKVQAGYKIQPLSAFLGQPAPPPAPKIDFVKPLSAAAQRTSLEFFNELNFVLQLCPTHPSEAELMVRFAKLGIGGGRRFEPQTFSPEVRKAITDGIADAWQALEEFNEQVDAKKFSSADVFGSREFLKNNYIFRMAGTVRGIWGNAKEEAIYPAYFVDSKGQKLDGSQNRYTLRFPSGNLPPVNAFWSVTLYQLPSFLLSANQLNRYLINSPMLQDLKTDPDGGITLFVQHDSPGKDKEANWLPAPGGPFFVAMRVYWPKPDALDGNWKAPALERLN